MGDESRRLGMTKAPQIGGLGHLLGCLPRSLVVELPESFSQELLYSAWIYRCGLA